MGIEIFRGREMIADKITNIREYPILRKDADLICAFIEKDRQ